MVSVLGAGFVGGIIPSGVVPANILNIEQSYGLSHGEVGRIISVSMLFGGAFGALVGGWLSTRIGALHSMLLSFVLAGIALGSIGVLDSAVAVTAGLTGFFLAVGLMSSSNALATRMLPDGQRGITLLHATNGAGKLAGPVLASLFLYGAWRNSFLVVAVMVVALAVPALLARRDGIPAIGRRREGDRSAGALLWILAAGFGLIAGSEMAVVLWIPAFAESVRGFSASQANLLLTIFLIGLTGGRFAASALSSRSSPRRTIGLCGGLLVFVAPAVYLSTYVPVAVFMLLFGMGFSAVWPSYFSHLSRLFPEHVGFLAGLSVFSNQIGLATCALISGRLAEEHLSYPIIFGAVVLGAFILTFLMSSGDRTKMAAPDANT